MRLYILKGMTFAYTGLRRDVWHLSVWIMCILAIFWTPQRGGLAGFSGGVELCRFQGPGHFLAAPEKSRRAIFRRSLGPQVFG
jgi:hypothetical protein